LKEDFRGVPTIASNSANRAARRSPIAAYSISRAPCSASRGLNRGGSVINTLTYISTPRATRLGQPGE
jgi:hypothetical protein